jgi:glycosyltransferase involved in cell wall biosynthesis
VTDSRYDSVFLHASFQFCGHVDEYFIANTRHLSILRLQTRFGTGGHRLERYEGGRLVEDRPLASSKGILSYYFLYSFHHNRELARHARDAAGDTFAVFTHPVVGFGMGMQRLFRRVRFVFWPWDWYPPASLPLKVYAMAVRSCARRADALFALTPAIARELGRNARVVMLGMRRLPVAEVDRSASKRILVVGQLRHGQGIETILDFLAARPEYSLALLGAAARGFEKVVHARLRAGDLGRRVVFPNRFVAQEELSEAAAECFCGLALYDTDPGNVTHYADPGKVKSYLEMGLPVVMTRISGIVPFVEKFRAGEVIDSPADLPGALDRIAADPGAYAAGARAFARHFDFETYYASHLRLQP